MRRVNTERPNQMGLAKISNKQVLFFESTVMRQGLSIRTLPLAESKEQVL
jgi:hypothetical protein